MRRHPASRHVHDATDAAAATTAAKHPCDRGSIGGGFVAIGIGAVTALMRGRRWLAVGAFQQLVGGERGDVALQQV